MKKVLIILAMAGLTAVPPVEAYEWTVNAFESDPRNVVMAPLIEAFRFHAEPAAVWYLEQLDGDLVSRRRFDTFSYAMARATYAAFEYTYLRDGESVTRIYYAMSGPANPPTGLATSPSPLVNYMVEDATRIHAHLLADDSTRLVPTQLEDEPTESLHQRDAELKAARSIERDIQRGIITRGGTLHAFISQPMCDSCQHIMHQLGRYYDIDINVVHLEGNLSQAYRQFRLMLNRYMDTVLVRIQRPGHPHPTPPPSAGMCARLFVR
ncbi:hypothetical protein [Luteibacter aegosomatissinici]|uniref:hypothetical protein n=1 Tax=Luteibacter aegosomatissinici TaxID=2911539 RepID=UPI001FF92918|nr:hypothetical protein [Luteibacter aegosomatissinici]UPG94939.1 hypothetical protein L2Y97_02190 [Luteibacter aegosomatissinici]